MGHLRAMPDNNRVVLARQKADETSLCRLWHIAMSATAFLARKWSAKHHETSKRKYFKWFEGWTRREGDTELRL